MSGYSSLPDAGAAPSPDGYEAHPEQNIHQTAIYNVPSYESEQPTSGLHSTGLPYDEVGATGCNLESAKRVFLSSAGALRAAEFLLSMLAFAILSSQPSFDSVASFGYLVFVMVLVWLYSGFIIPAMLVDFHSGYSWLYLVELVLDGIFAVLSFVAGIVVAVKCDSEVGLEDTKFCSVYPKAKWSCAFAFLCSFALCGSVVASFLRYRSPPRGGNAALLV